MTRPVYRCRKCRQPGHNARRCGAGELKPTKPGRTVSIQLELHERASARAAAVATPLAQVVASLLRQWLDSERSIPPPVNSKILGHQTRKLRGHIENPPLIGRSKIAKTGMTPIAEHPVRSHAIPILAPGLCAVCANDSIDVVKEPLGRGGALVNVCIDCRTEPIVEGSNSFGHSVPTRSAAKGGRA